MACVDKAKYKLYQYLMSESLKVIECLKHFATSYMTVKESQQNLKAKYVKFYRHANFMENFAVLFEIVVINLCERDSAEEILKETL